MFHRRGRFCPRLHMRRMSTLVTRSTNSSMFVKFLILLKRLMFHECLHNFKWHKTHIIVCKVHQLKICHLYHGTFTQCICLGTGSLFVCGFRGKARPLRARNFDVMTEVVQPIFCFSDFTDRCSSQWATPSASVLVLDLGPRPHAEQGEPSVLWTVLLLSLCTCDLE